MNSFDAVAFTSPGGRGYNEDAVLLVEDGGRLTAILADGLGAYGGGEIASAAAVAALRQHLPPLGYMNDAAFSACFAAANATVLAQQKPGLSMKSTAVALILEPGYAAFAHTGDSRGYAFRGGNIVCQTFDHSVSQMAVFRGDIDQAQIRSHPSRSQLLRALGIEGGLLEEITALAPPQAGDAFLLCSDGFWEYVTEEEMAADVLKARNAREWLNFMLNRIEGRVAKDHDNLSAIAVRSLTASFEL